MQPEYSYTYEIKKSKFIGLYFKVNNTKDLTKEQYAEIVQHCNTLPDFKGE